uniref:Uncharacterized protein n=1 Tax=Mycena chlorophos TaxID=658473 RepID=A0ABQ0M094_MYCCL|nr:predicted protein [Mycena chlorophos]
MSSRSRVAARLRKSPSFQLFSTSFLDSSSQSSAAPSTPKSAAPNAFSSSTAAAFTLGHSSTASLSLPPSDPLFAKEDLDWFGISASVDGHGPVADSPEASELDLSGSDESPVASTSISVSGSSSSEDLNEFKRRLTEATNLPQTPYSPSTLLTASSRSAPSLHRSLSASASTWPRVLDIFDTFNPFARPSTPTTPTTPGDPLTPAPQRRSASVRSVVQRRLSRSRLRRRRQDARTPDLYLRGRRQDGSESDCWDHPDSSQTEDLTITLTRTDAVAPPSATSSVGLARIESRGSHVSSTSSGSLLVFAATTVDPMRLPRLSKEREPEPPTPTEATPFTDRPRRDSTDSDMSFSLTFAAPKARLHQRTVDLDVDLDIDDVASPQNNIYRLQASTADASVLYHGDDMDDVHPALGANARTNHSRISIESTASMILFAPKGATAKHSRTVDMDVEPVESLDNAVYRLQAATEVPVVYHAPDLEIAELSAPLASPPPPRMNGNSKLARTLGTDLWGDAPAQPQPLSSPPLSTATKQSRRLSISALNFLPSRPSSPPAPATTVAAVFPSARRKPSWTTFAALIPFGAQRNKSDEPSTPSELDTESVSDTEATAGADSMHHGHGRGHHRRRSSAQLMRRRHSVASSLSSFATAQRPLSLEEDPHNEYLSRSSTPTPKKRQSWRPEGPFYDDNGYYIAASTYPTLFQPTINRDEDKDKEEHQELEWVGEWNRGNMYSVIDALRRL